MKRKVPSKEPGEDSKEGTNNKMTEKRGCARPEGKKSQEVDREIRDGERGGKPAGKKAHGKR